MGVFEIFNLADDCIWGIWKIESEESGLLDSLTHFSFPEHFSSIHHPKKRLEWLSSRLLMKALVEKLGKKFYGVQNDSYGKPHLKNYNYHVSLSHCGDYSVAIIHRKKNVGIDIEIVKNKLQLVVKKFLTDSEIDDVQGNMKKLCVYWCVKEVIYKLHGKRSISLKNNIFVQAFDFIAEGGICKVNLSFENKVEQFVIRYTSFGDYFIAFNE